MMGRHNERRYPPAPYPARSAELKSYRDGWDLGWQHYGALRSQVLSYEAGLSDGPRRHGYRDGVIARFMREERARAEEREARAQDREADRERWLNDTEAPW